MLPKLLIFTFYLLSWHQLLANSPSTPQQDTDQSVVATSKQSPSLEHALNLFNANNFQESIAELNKLGLESNSALISYNLAINYWKLENKALAFANIRTCLDQHPGYGACESFIDSLSKQDLKLFYQKRDLAERILIDLHRSTHWSLFGVLSLLLFSLFYRSLLRSLFPPKKSDSEDFVDESSQSKWLLVGIFGFLWLFSTALSGYIFYMSNISLGTIVENTKGKLNASEESPEILNLSAGEEALLIRKLDDWIQVEDLNGKRAWLKSKFFIQTTGSQRD